MRAPGLSGGPWLGSEPLLLASTSRVRRDLLLSAGLPVETEASGVDERALESTLGGIAPGELALRLAQEKAAAVANRRPGRLVIGADQVLASEGRTWPKPVSAAAATDQIARLAGRTHALHVGVSIRQAGREAETVVETAQMTMRVLTSAAIAAYVAAAGDAATRSAGGYEVEGLGIHLFARIEGDTSTILGLPMLPLLAALRRIGLLAW